MKKAIILGCSHAAGAEIDPDPSIGYQKSYPAQIAQDLGYEFENHSLYGGSNDSIFRIFVEQFDRLSSDSLVLACWTGYERTEIYHDTDQQWVQITPNSKKFNLREKSSWAPQGMFVDRYITDQVWYVKYTDYWQRYALDENGFFAKLNAVKNIMALNSLARTKNIKVLNFQSFLPIEQYWPMISHFYWPMGSYDFSSWCRDHGHLPGPKLHFRAESHRRFADTVLDKLDIRCP